MKIAIDLRSLMETGGKISGVENYVLNLVNHLHGQPGIQFFGFYNNFKPIKMPAELSKNLEIKSSRIPNKIFNLLLRLRLLRFEKLYGDFDLLFMPDLRPFSISEKTLLAITVHDLSPVMHPEFYSLRRRLWHRFISYRSSFRRADLLFAVSEYTKFDLQKIFNIDGQKIATVYPGLDHSLFQRHLDERIMHKVREKYQLPENYILSISTLEPRKNIVGLIRAFEQADTSENYLVLAGRFGWLYSEIITAVNNSQKKDKIKLLGYVDEADKPYLIFQSKALCYSSFYEGFGFQPLEAMAVGVPVITSARTSMPEICGNAALFIEPYNSTDLAFAIEQLLSDQKLREQLIERGLQRAAEFSWQKTAADTAQKLLTLQNKSISDSVIQISTS